MFGIFRKKESVGDFWDWLAANTDRIQLGRRQPDLAKVQDDLGQTFHKFYPDLVWEVTPASSPPWTFCVSADGDLARFPQVEQVVNSAPAVRGWKIQAFRRRGKLTAQLEMDGRKLGYEDIWCAVSPKDQGISVTLLIRGLTAANHEALGGGALILLNNAVGEYDSVTKIKELDRAPLPSNPQHQPNLFPLAELPGYLDQLPPKP
jgi:hypothetical protein